MEKLNKNEEEKRPIPESIRKRKYGDNEIKTIKVETRTLTSCWRSKEDIYKYLSEQKQIFLPSKRGCTIAFLKQILSGEKHYFYQQDIKLFQIPQFEEFQANDKANKYFPDLEENQLLERNFFFGIIGTLYTDWLKKIVDEALKHRNTKIDEEEKGEFVLVTEKFFKDLSQDKFISILEKPGKGIYLLQKKILKRKMFKSRQKYQIAQNPEELLIPCQQRKHLNTTQSTTDNANQSISNFSLINQETDEEMRTGI